MAKDKLNDTEFALGNISPIYAMSKMASGEAGLTDFGLMGAMNRFGGDRSKGGDGLTEEERTRFRAMTAPQAAPAKMKCGGAVKKMAAGGKVRGCGIAVKGKTRGRVR
jgi:hypothetical protein